MKTGIGETSFHIKQKLQCCNTLIPTPTVKNLKTVLSLMRKDYVSQRRFVIFCLHLDSLLYKLHEVQIIKKELVNSHVRESRRQRQIVSNKQY